MKKTLLILLTLIIGINLNTQAETFSSVYNGDTIYYFVPLNSNIVSVTYRGSSYSHYTNEYSGSISIPDSVQYNGIWCRVATINGHAFRGCSGLTSITIPASVTSIGGHAFKDCTSLNTINFNAINCPAVGSPDLPAFSGCYNLSSLIIGDSVIKIPENAFYDCSGLSSLTIPNSVTSIGKNAFYGCSGLTSITIPNNIVSIGNSAFKNNTSLNVVYFNSTNCTSMGSAGYPVFQGCNNLSTILIGDSVINIAEVAFKECTHLTSINIPNSVISIGARAFYGCSDLNSLIIGNSVDTIDVGAFANCTSLDTVYFYSINCSKMGRNDWPVFVNSNNISSIIIGNNVTKIPNNSFKDCIGLTRVIIPKSVNYLGASSFEGCTSLNTVYYNAINCQSIGNYSTSAFQQCSNLATVIIGDSVNFIPGNIFTGCFRLSSLTIGNSVTLIDTSAFEGCVLLSSLIIPNSVVTICISAFADCSGLTSLIIGNSVTSIGYDAFYECRNLTSIKIKAITPPSIYFNSFYRVNRSIPFYVPCNSVQNYQYGTYWSEFTNRIAFRTPTFISTSICQGDTYTNYNTNLTSAGIYHIVRGCDSIILNLSITPTVYTNFYDTICKGVTYNNYGFNFISNTNGIYTRNLQAINGCDSIIRLFLRVNPTYNDTLIAEICMNETYHQFGFNENTTGFYTQNLQTIKGCDSIVNLSLIVNPIYNDTIYEEICSNETYNLNGINICTTGFYTQNIQTIKGCDSIINLSLVVNPIFIDTIYGEICQGETYTLNGFNESTTGLHTQNLQTIKGCDSILNLSLVVNPIYNDTITAEICQGETYSLNGFNVNTAGLHTQTLQSTKGCDSTVNLTLTVNQPSITNISAEICQGETYTLNGFNVSTAGLYTLNLQTVKGCDSIVNLTLTINPISITTFHDTICQGNTYNGYGFSFTADTTGRYTQNLQTFNGCDSTIILNLVVNPTPIIPENLDVQVMSNFINITWQSNGSSYDIYRNDSLIANVTQPIYIDYDVVNAQSYCYKVKSINGNCESEFSNVVCKTFLGLNDISSSNIEAKLYPNPASNKSKLEVEGLKSETKVIVYDLLGKVIKSYKINPTMKELKIDVNGFAKGIYNIRIINDEISISRKLIVE